MWLGFRKATIERSLSDVVKGYIGEFKIMSSLWNIATSCLAHSVIDSVYLAFYALINLRNFFLLTGVILVASFVTVVNIHQTYKRSLRGRSISKPQYMFPRITRADADKNILSCVKYILNYGFYRFGVEVRYPQRFERF